MAVPRTWHDIVFVQHQATQFDAPLFRALVDVGVDVHAIYSSASSPHDDEMGRTPDFGNVLGGYGWSVATSRALDIHIGRHVVISGWSSLLAWTAIAYSCQLGVSVGLRFDSVRPATTSLGAKERIRRMRARLALRSVAVWHPVGANSEKFAISVATGFARTVLPIPYAIDVKKFAGVRRRAAGALQVLVVSKLTARENVECAVRAVALVPEAELVVVGDGPAREALESLAREMGARVIFEGYQPYERLPEFYRNADIFVHPARREVWGVSVHEAMAAALPVLASTEVGAADDLLAGWAEAVRFRPEDSVGLAALLQRFTDYELRRKMGAANRRLAFHSTPTVTASNLVALLEGLSRGRRV